MISKWAGWEALNSHEHLTPGTDKTDRRAFVSSVSSSPKVSEEFSEEVWEFERSGDWIHGTNNRGEFHAWRITGQKGQTKLWTD